MSRSCPYRPMTGVGRALAPFVVMLAVLAGPRSAIAQATAADIDRLIGALQGPTPMLEDLQVLSDRFGGRLTGSEANLRSVEWAIGRFREAGVEVRREAFPMPRRWVERSARATVEGPDLRFEARVAAMPYSIGTPASGRRAALVLGGRGSVAELDALGPRVRGAFVLIEQDLLVDVAGLFKEYAEVAAVEPRVMAAGALGVVYVGSRPFNTLYRHNAAGWAETDYLAMSVERQAGLRAARLLRAGAPLTLDARLDIDDGGPYESHNVIGEIRGTSQPDEVVLIGAHLDSWALGQGVLDNGANAVMVIDIARQMKRLGIRPSRTIRFALWNGEEQGLYGSLGYTKTHAATLDRHVMVTSIDIGTGRINGFFTGGRPEVAAAVERALEPVAGLGPFANVDVPVVGTDNFDFMMEGVANLVANQESSNYGPNYHAQSDQLDRADPVAMRLNAGTIAAMTLRFAEMPYTWGRQARSDIEGLVASTDLEQQMRQFGMWKPWLAGERGRRRP